MTSCEVTSWEVTVSVGAAVVVETDACVMCGLEGQWALSLVTDIWTPPPRSGRLGVLNFLKSEHFSLCLEVIYGVIYGCMV